jgi:hypothetical protein
LFVFCIGGEIDNELSVELMILLPEEGSAVEMLVGTVIFFYTAEEAE